MSESASPGVPEGAAGVTAPALSAEARARVLADFERWLAEAVTPVAPPGAPSPLPLSPTLGERGRGEGAGPQEPDLHTLLGQFIALRHEINLQTKATRAQQEQNAETLRQLSEALKALRAAPSPSEAEEERLLKTLVDLYDALAVAGREVTRLEAATPSLFQDVAAAESEAEEPAPAPPRPAPSWWPRWFGGAASDSLRAEVDRLREQIRRDRQARAERDRKARDAAERVGRSLASLVAGYAMSLQRLERALRQHGLEPIATTGQRFDPERMEVVEAVAGSGRPAGEVLDEVRRGYLRDGRVFRYAQVRVARS